MHLKRFSIIIIVRIVFLLATMVGFSIIFGRADLFFNQVILGILIMLQVVDLIRYVRSTNRDLAKFLLAIKHTDFTVHFGQERDSSFQSLHAAFREIVESYRRVNAEREAQYHYLHLLVSHINVGIISLRGDDEIVLMNPSALELLQTDRFHHWHNLRRTHPHLVLEVEGLLEGESKLVEWTIGGKIKRLSLQVNSATLLQESYRIITLQDIEQEINQSEVDAYHKLIRILTHEIMNSVTPIASLSETLLMLLHDEEGQRKSWKEVGESYLEELAYSLQTIGRRSDGLLHFVEDYRTLTKLPQPQPEAVPVYPLLRTVGRLMQAELRQQRIDLRIQVASEELEIWGDPRLIEQVLINLVTNSMHALKGTSDPYIALRSYASPQGVVVEVTDNGSGIAADKVDQVFVPFFSTKEQGSGIGLSLSRHIMTLHRGTISVQSQPNVQTSFFLRFRATGQLQAAPPSPAATIDDNILKR